MGRTSGDLVNSTDIAKMGIRDKYIAKTTVLGYRSEENPIISIYKKSERNQASTYAVD